MGVLLERRQEDISGARGWVLCLSPPNMPSWPKERATPAAVARRLLHRTNRNAKTNSKKKPRTPPTTPPTILGVSFPPPEELDAAVPAVDDDVDENVAETAVAPSTDEAVELAYEAEEPEDV